jgi:hypothetical protein
VRTVPLADPEAGVYGGVYVFESAQATDEYLSSELFAGVGSTPGFAGITVTRFGVLDGPPSRTRGLVATHTSPPVTVEPMLAEPGGSPIVGRSREPGALLRVLDGEGPRVCFAYIYESIAESRRQHVADSALGDQVPRPPSVPLQLTAQTGHVDPQIVDLTSVLRAPHHLQQLAIRHRLSSVPRKLSEYPVLPRRQVDWPPGPPDFSN